jgi:hypothetical protein
VAAIEAILLELLEAMAPLFYCSCTDCKCVATVLLTEKDPPDPPDPPQPPDPLNTTNLPIHSQRSAGDSHTPLLHPTVSSTLRTTRPPSNSEAPLHLPGRHPCPPPARPPAEGGSSSVFLILVLVIIIFGK